MQWTGLPASSLTAIGAAGAAAIVGLYILKLKRRRVAVPFAPIWQRVLRDQNATALFSQLKRVLSLLLQLVLLALLVLALGDPREVGNSSSRNLVVLVDASASMKAIDVATALSPTRARIDDARDEVRKLVAGLSGADRMLIAALDAEVTPLSTLTGETADLEQAAGRIVATDTRADFARGLRFAKDVLAGLSQAEIVVVSDGALAEPRDAFGQVQLGAPRLKFVPIGKRGRNAAISQFSVRRYPLERDRYEVMVELTNTSSEPEELELRLLGDGNVVDITKLRLGPGERAPRFYPNLSGARRTLEAVLALAGGGHDDLPADDHAYALLPDRPRVRVLCVTQGNTYLEAALLLTAYLDVTYVTPAQYPAGAPGTYDVTIFDDVAPVPAPGSGSLLYLNPSGEASPVKVDPAVQSNVGFDTLDRKSPLLRYTAIDDVYVGAAHKLVPERGDQVVGASEKGPLLVRGVRDQRRFVALGFRPRDSDLVLRVAWPVFVLNLLNEFVADDASYLSSFRTGEVWHVPVPADAQEAWLSGPGLTGRRRVPVQDGRAVVLGLSAGFYAIETVHDGVQTKSEFAANLADVEESSIAPHADLVVDGRPADRVSFAQVSGLREWWMALLALVVLITTVEWATYHRRITV
jgi:hypothetical protein